jgi:hypothetical protein
MAGRVKARRLPHVSRDGWTQWDSLAAQPGSAVVGWERERTGGAHASMRGERVGAEDGRCE